MNINNYIKHNTVLFTYSGSKLYGTDTPDSDTDYTGLFYKTKNELFGLKRIDEISYNSNNKSQNNKDDIDVKLFSIHKFFELSMKANPNIIELFFIPDNLIIHKNLIYDEIKQLSSLFITKRIFNSYFGYARAQKKLLQTKTDRFISLQKSLDYLQNINRDILNEKDVDHLSKIHYGAFKNKQGNNRKYISKQPVNQIINHIQKQINEYGHRLENIKKYGYECKFGSHLIRLMYEGIEIATTKNIILPLQYKDIIKDIKLGKMSYDNVLKEYHKLHDEFNKIEIKSQLPSDPNYNKINEILINLTEKIIKG